MTLPPQFTSALRDRITLSDLVGRRVKLARAGREYKGCCPFHKEKTPSFYVNDDKQFYHCFGCGAHGDAIDFVMQHDNLSFIEAVETLAAQAGMAVPQQSREDVEQARKQKDLYSLMNDAAHYFSHVLRETKDGADGLRYLRDRGVSDELMDSFRLGFSPVDGQTLRRHMKDKGYTDAQMIEAGVIRNSERGGEPYSFFRDRVMFPVADRRGRVVAFGGRVLPEHLRPVADGRTPPKYINSSDSVLFHKGRMLYGESHARTAAANGESVIVVEGYLDVMACWHAGYKGAVAPLGTALTEEQIVILWKMIPQEQKIPVLCFDGDEAGRRAAARACERLLPLLKPDHSAIFAFLPEGQDPDSLLRAQGKKAFVSVLDAAMPLIDFLWTHHTDGRRLDTPEARAGLEKALEDDVLRIPDRGVQQYYRQAFRDRLFNLFRNNKGSRSGYGKQAAVTGPVLKIRRPAFSGRAMMQQILLASLINHPEIFDGVEEDFGRVGAAGDIRLDALRQVVLRALGADLSLDREGLKNHLISQGYVEELELVLSEAVYTHAGFARPQADIPAVLEGWRDTWRLLHEQVLRQEIGHAGQAYRQDITEENDRKMKALHDVHKASGQ